MFSIFLWLGKQKLPTQYHNQEQFPKKSNKIDSRTPLMNALPLKTNPTSSVNVKSSDSPSNTEGDSEDMTSNDTLPVSNETETELTVNETGPGYFDLKDKLGVNTTQEVKETPKVMKDVVEKSKNSEIIGGKDHTIDMGHHKLASFGKDEINEVRKPDVINVEENSEKRAGNSTKNRELEDLIRSVLGKGDLEPTAVEKMLHGVEDSDANKKTRNNEKNRKFLNNLLENSPSSESVTEFYPLSKVSSQNPNASSKLVANAPLNNLVSDSASKGLILPSKKLNSKDGTYLGKVLKRVERILRKSRISSRHDLQRMRKLVYDLVHASRLQPSFDRPDGNLLVLNATEGIDSRLKGIEKRMHVADGNQILNNITSVLVQLMQNIQEPHGKFLNSTAQPKLVDTIAPKDSFIHTAKGGHHLKMTDMVQRMKHLEKVFQKHLKKEKLTKCKMSSSTLKQITITGGLDKVKHISYGTVNNMEQCITKCCNNLRCDLSFLENRQCYGVDCKHQKCLLAPADKNTGVSSVALLTKRISANIGFTGIPVGGFLTDKCDVQTHLITDSSLGQGGLKGNATVLSHVTDTWSCGMACCQQTTCNVAMIQDGMCYVISCLTDGPCFESVPSPGQKISLAFVRRSRSRVPMLQPSLSQSVVKSKATTTVTTPHAMKHTPQQVLYRITPTPSLAYSKLHTPSSSSTLIKKEHNSTSTNLQNQPPLPSPKPKDLHLNGAFKTSDTNHKDNAQTPTNAKETPNTCVQTFPVANVTLQAGFSAGKYEIKGKVKNVSTCVDHCCRSEKCNVALVLQNMCFLLTCTSNKVCRNEPLLSNQFQSSLVYVARSPLEADMVKSELVPTLRRELSNVSRKSQVSNMSEMKAKKRLSESLPSVRSSSSRCSIAFIASHAKLLHGFESGEIVVVGSIKGGMSECISKCCGYNGCNASLVIGEQCFLVRCYNKESCQIVESDSSDVETSVAIVTREDDDHFFPYLEPPRAVTKTPYVVPSSSSALRQMASSEKFGVHSSLPNGPATVGYYAPISRPLANSISPSLASTHRAILTTPVPNVGPRVLTHKTQEDEQNPEASVLDVSKKKETTLNTEEPRQEPHIVTQSTADYVHNPQASVLKQEPSKFVLDNSVAAVLNKKANALHWQGKDEHINQTTGLEKNPKASVTKVEKETALHGDASQAGSEIFKELQDVFKNMMQEKNSHDVHNDIPHESLNSNHPLENLEKKNSQNSGVVGKMFQGKPIQMADLKTSGHDELLSKVKNLSLEQEKLEKNIPELKEIIGKIQNHLESHLKPKDTATKVERKDSITQLDNMKNSSAYRIPKSSVNRPMSPHSPSSPPIAANVPTPKLFQSPTVVVTTPSLIGSRETQSTNHKTPVTSVLPSKSAEGTLRTYPTKPDIGKQIVMALKDVGVLPAKRQEVHFSSNETVPKGKELNEALEVAIKPDQKTKGRSSVVPPEQRLLNFLEEQIGLKAMHSKTPESMKNITEPRTGSQDSMNSKQISGLMDEQRVLNQRIKHLESIMGDLKSHNNVHPEKAKLEVRSSIAEFKPPNLQSRVHKMPNEQMGLTSAEGHGRFRSMDDEKYLIDQLRSMVRSELAQTRQSVAPTSRNLHSTITKQPESVDSSTRKHEVALEHNLNRLYNHAVAEMEKALESSAGSEEQRRSSVTGQVGRKNVEDVGLGKSKKVHFVDMAVNNSTSREKEHLHYNEAFSENDISTPKKKNNMALENYFHDEGVHLSDPVSKQNQHQSQETRLSSHDKLSPSSSTVPVNPEHHKHGFNKLKDSSVYRTSSHTPKKDSSNENEAPTCHHSEVQYDVTLRGGIAREGVKDGGIAGDMSECIRLCCERSSCNVAFMLKDNCFLVPCKDAKLCQAVKLPSKTLNTKISFVSRESKASVELKVFDNVVKALSLAPPNNPNSTKASLQRKKSELPSRSTPAEIAGATNEDLKKLSNLPSNIKSDNSTIQTLIEEIDMLGSQTGNAKKTKTIESQSTLPSSTITKNSGQQNTLIVKNLPLKPKLCPYGKVEYNTTIRGGLAATNYKYGGKVADISECVERCCELDDCDIAFIVSNECFLLSCQSENLCESVPAVATELNPKVVRILHPGLGKKVQRVTGPSDVLKEALQLPSRKKANVFGSKKEHSSSGCLKSDPVVHVVPEGGMKPGNYKDFGEVKSMEECVGFCCGWSKCSMAFMVLNGCFGVSCDKHCPVVPSKDLSFPSKVVYVKRHQDVLQWLNSQSYSRSTVPDTPGGVDRKGEGTSGFVNSTSSGKNGSTDARQAENENVNPDTKSTGNSHEVSTLTSSPTGRISNSKSTLKMPTVSKNDSDEAASHGPDSKELSALKELADELTISKDKRGDGIKPQINVKAAVEPKFFGEEKGQCIPGEIERDVTLGGGIKAGSYTEQGEVLNMDECVEWCCKEQKCDVAMVIKGICYTVSCYDQRNCVSVPVRRIQYHPSLVHVTRGKRDADGAYSTNKGSDASLQEIVEGSSGVVGDRKTPGSFDDDNDDSSLENENSNIENELVDLLTEQSSGDSDGYSGSKGINKGHRYSSLDTSHVHTSEVPSDTPVDSVPPSEKATYDVSKNRGINTEPIQASRRRLGMSTDVDPPSCLHSPISYNVTLRHGLRSGHFKHQGRVDNFEACFSSCCHDNDCNLVFMLHNYCYLVTCYDHESCALKRLVSATNKDLVVAFVYKDKSDGLVQLDEAFAKDKSSLPAYYQNNNEQNRREPGLVKDDQYNVRMSSQASDSSSNVGSTYPEMNTHKLDIHRPYKRRSYPHVPPSSDQNYQNGNRLYTKSLQAPQNAPEESVQFPQKTLSCIPGPERYFTTLRGGLNPGYFTDIGLVSNMDTCKQYCCEKSDCDVALVQSERCFLVNCPRTELCEDIPASSTRGVSRVSHMFRKGVTPLDRQDREGVMGYQVDNMLGNKDTNIHDNTMRDVMDNEGTHGGIRDSVNMRSDEDMRGNGDTIRGMNGLRGVVGLHGGETNGGNGEIHGNIGIREDNEENLGVNKKRKDIIPSGYGDNGNLRSRSPLEANDNNDKEMNLLRDAIADIEVKERLGRGRSPAMRDSSKIPTPEVKTDFEKLLDQNRQEPLTFDDSAAKRKHDSPHSEGLGDVASDILSNILKHRTDDSIESIWSKKVDPLQSEITKARETNTPEKIEKELRHTEDRKIPEEHTGLNTDLVGQSVSQGDGDRMNGDSHDINSNMGRQGEKGGTSGANGDLDDQSKLIQTLYTLVKDNAKANQHPTMKQKDDIDSQVKIINDLAEQTQNSKPESPPHKETTNDDITDRIFPESDANVADDDYSDYFDNHEGYQNGDDQNSLQKEIHHKELPTHFKHVDHPKLSKDENDVHYRDYNDDDEINFMETEKNEDDGRDGGQSGGPEGKVNGNLQERQNEELGNEMDENYKDGRKSEEQEKAMNKMMDEDLSYISEKMDGDQLQDGNNYGPKDQLNDDNFSEYDEDSPYYPNDLPGMDYYDTLGVKRKLRHHRPTLRKLHPPNYASGNKGHFMTAYTHGRKPLGFGEEKVLPAQGNGGLVINELEKIQDELADIKSQPRTDERITEHVILKPSSATNSKLESSNDKESIIDILAGLKDVGRAKSNGIKKSNNTGELNTPMAKPDEERTILKQIDELKKQIGNISKSLGSSEKAKNSQKVDDIGDEISELLGENWELDKRSRIPTPGITRMLGADTGDKHEGKHYPVSSIYIWSKTSRPKSESKNGEI